MSDIKVTTVIAELNIFLESEEKLSPAEADRAAHDWIEEHYPGEKWQLLGSEGFEGHSAYRSRVLFQRVDTKKDDREWIVGDLRTAPWLRTEVED